jgi:hypothetical protein
VFEKTITATESRPCVVGLETENHAPELIIVSQRAPGKPIITSRRQSTGHETVSDGCGLVGPVAAEIDAVPAETPTKHRTGIKTSPLINRDFSQWRDDRFRGNQRQICSINLCGHQRDDYGALSEFHDEILSSIAPPLKIFQSFPARITPRHLGRELGLLQHLGWLEARSPECFDQVGIIFLPEEQMIDAIVTMRAALRWLGDPIWSKISIVGVSA